MGILEVTDETFDKELLQHPVGTLVVFYSVHDPVSRILKPLLEELSTEFGDRLKLIKIESEENPEWGQKYKVRGVPTLILLKNDTEVSRSLGFRVGEQNKLRLKEWIEGNL